MPLSTPNLLYNRFPSFVKAITFLDRVTTSGLDEEMIRIDTKKIRLDWMNL